MRDIHIHFGQFREQIFSPDTVINELVGIGITQIGLMPLLSKSGDNFLESHMIMAELISKYDCLIIPILWIHPSTSLSSIGRMINELPYKMIKIHGYIHDWHKHQVKLQKVVSLAKHNKLPIMFHTGGRQESFAISYKKICKANYDNIFILAHSRPVKETINILRNCPNVYCDSAFLPMNDLKLIIKGGFDDRILFGTDYPIVKSFNDGSRHNKLYTEIISELKSKVSEKIFKKITEDNFKNIFR